MTTAPNSTQSLTITSSPSSTNTMQNATTTCADCIDCASGPDLDFSAASFGNDTGLGDGSDTKKRALAARFPIEKRNGGFTSTQVGTVFPGAPHCSVASYIPKPLYPGPNSIWTADVMPASRSPYNLAAYFATATQWAVPTYGPRKCDPPGWTFMSSRDVVAPQNVPLGNTNTKIGRGWQIGGDNELPGAKTVNVDHVYEQSVLDEFFRLRGLPGRSGCPTIRQVFNRLAGGSTTRLNYIFDQLGNYNHPDFVGMDATLNQVKGSFWNPSLISYVMPAPDYDSLKVALGQLALIMNIVNHPTVVGHWQNTHGRIYQAFQRIDNSIRIGAANPVCSAAFMDSAGNPLQATWAASYSVYITDKISTQNGLIQSIALSFSSGIPTDPVQARATGPEIQNIRANAIWMKGFNSLYPMAQMTLPSATNWPTMKRKRDDNTSEDWDVDACPLAAPSAVGTGLTGTMLITPAPALSPTSIVVPAAANATSPASPPIDSFAAPSKPAFHQAGLNNLVSLGSSGSIGAASTSSIIFSSGTISSSSAQSSIGSSSAQSSTAAASAQTTPITHPDPCGPAQQKSTFFNTCNTKVSLTNTPSQYGVLCQSSGTTPITYTSCATSYVVMCKNIAQFGSTFDTDEWVWLQEGTCAVGVFMPSGMSAAQWPSQSDCETNIFQAMVDSCSTTTTLSNLGSVNLAQWPSFTDKTQTGQQVEFGYPSYMIAPAQPAGLGSDAFGWTTDAKGVAGSADEVLGGTSGSEEDIPSNTDGSLTARGEGARCPAGSCFEWCVCV